MAAVRWAPGGLHVAAGWVPGGGRAKGRWPQSGCPWAPEWPRWPETPGPETAARAKVTQRPTLTHSRDRPRGPAYRGPPASGRAARPQFPRGAGPGRAGRGRGRPGRAGDGPGGGGRGPVTCGRRRRASPPCPAGWSSSRPRSRSPSRASGRRAAARLGPRLAAPRAGPPRGEGARRHGCGTWEPAPAAPVRQDGGARPAARPHGPQAGPRRARGPQHQAGRSPKFAASGVGGGAPGRPARTAAWRAGPSVRQDGRAGSPCARQANAPPTPGPRRPPASASASSTGRCRRPRGERCRPPGSRARGPSPRLLAPPYAKMADVLFLPHFRPRLLPLGPDWPRLRTVASRCGTVGATLLSVGGRRGKMDAGEAPSGRGATRGLRSPVPSAAGASPSLGGCAGWARGRGAVLALTRSGAGTASVGRPARM